MCATTGLVFWCGLFACFLLSLFVVEPAKRTKFKPFPLDQNHRIMSPRCSATAPSRPSTSRSGRRSRVAFRTSLCRHLRSKSNQRTHTHTHTHNVMRGLSKPQETQRTHPSIRIPPSGCYSCAAQDCTLGATGDTSPGFQPGIHLKAKLAIADAAPPPTSLRWCSEHVGASGSMFGVGDHVNLCSAAMDRRSVAAVDTSGG